MSGVEGTITIKAEVVGVERTGISIADLALKVGKAEKSIESFAAETRDAEKDVAALGRKAMDVGRGIAQLDAAHSAGARAAKLHGHEILNLSRQFTDVGISATMGMSPLMILAQQGGPIAETWALASKRGVTFSGTLRDLAESAGGMARKHAGLLTGLGAAAGVVGLAAGAYSVYREQIEATTEAVQASHSAYGNSTTALMETAKYTDVASASTAAFAGHLGTAAEKALALAGANKQAALSSLMLAKDQLGAANVNSRALTTEGLWETANKRSWNPKDWAAGIGATFAAGASLFDGAGQGKLSGAISGNAAQLRVLDEEIAKLNKLNLDAFVDKGTGAMRATGAAARDAAQELKRLQELAETFVSGEYLNAFRDLQDGRTARQLVAAQAQNFGYLENKAAAVGEAYSKGMEEAATAAQLSRDAVQSIGSAIDDVFAGIRDHDWGSAFGGLLKAMGEVKSGWGSLDGSGRISAISNVASAAGAAVGGAAGAGLMGAAAGAGGGASLAIALGLASNPAGWVIAGAAAVGGILGLFGGSKAAKREKEEARAQAAADAASLAMQVANQHREIETRYLALTGDALGALNLTREAEMAGIDSTNQARLLEVYALEDANRLRGLSIQLLDAQGQTERATTMRREDALKALTPAEADLTRQIWATIDATNARTAAEAAATEAYALAEQARAAAKQIWDDQVRNADTAIAAAEREVTAAKNAEAQSLRAAAQEQAQPAQSTISRLDGITASLKAFNATAGGSLSYAAADRAYRDIDRRGRLGDLDAGEKAASVFTQLLEISKTSSRTEIAYQRDVARTRLSSDAILAVAGRQRTVAEQQLDAANAQLAVLATINESVLSVAQAEANLAAALGVKARLTGIGAEANDNISFGSSSADIQRLLATGQVSGEGVGPSGPGYADLLLSQYYAGQLDPGSGTYLNLKAAGFASGGFHRGGARIVGENGPELAITGPEQIYSNSQTRQMFDNSAVVAELKALREELAAMRRAQDKTADNTGKTADNTRNIDNTMTYSSIKTRAA